MYNDPKLSAVLTKSAFDGQNVWQQRTGKHGEHTNHFVGKTAVSINSGEITSTINWGIDGSDVTISPDIEPLVDCYVIEHDLQEIHAGQLYKLRNSRGHVLAEARTQKGFGDKTQVYVRGKDRADVVKLFEQIRAGETAPESAGGRRGLIRSLRQREEYLLEQCHSLTDVWGTKVGELVLLQVSFDSLSSTNVRLERRIAELERENAELKKPKGFWQTFFRDFRKAYDAQVA